MWQDKAMALCSLAFGYSLIPQVVRIVRIKSASQFSWQTSVITTIGLIVFDVALFTLGMHLTFCTNMVQTCCWAFIVVAKIIYGGRSAE